LIRNTDCTKAVPTKRGNAIDIDPATSGQPIVIPTLWLAFYAIAGQE
jgi:hypothetical protein